MHLLAGRGADPRRPTLDEARLHFEQMLGYANHSASTPSRRPAGEALGNFPQAFTHLGADRAAFNLDRALDGHPPR